MMTRKLTNWKRAALSLLALPLLLVGCGNDSQTKGGATPPAAQADYQPVTLSTGGHTITINEAPKRAVSLNQHTTEIMLALGLEDRMVGTAYMDDKILPEYEAKYAKIPVLADQYPSLEVLLGANPDFVYGRKSAFSDKALGSVKSLGEKGINGYVARGTEVSGVIPTMDVVYEDILNLGKIFDIKDRSEQLVDKLKQGIADTQKKVGDVKKPLRVAVYDAGDTAMYTASKTLQTHLVELAGGKNVFDDLDKSWTEVSWEEVVKRDPEVFVINEYDKPSAAEKIASLKKHPALQDVSAIKNDRFVILPLSDAFEGVRNVRAVETLAKGFYPDRFQ